MPTRPLHLASLTGLRFFAAIHVLLYHAFPHQAWPGEPAAVRDFIDSGFVGVSLFFVLSGFILAYNYIHLSDARPVEPRDFWWGRVARIYPVYLFSLFVALPLFVPWVVDKLTNESLTGLAKVLITAGTNILLIQSWVPVTVAQWNSPAWSLACEAFFYLVFPVLGAWFVRMPRARLLPAAAVVWLATMAALWAYTAANPETAPLSARDSSLFSLGVVKYNPLMRLPEFIVGIAVGVHFLHRQQEPDMQQGGGAALAMGGALVSLMLLTRSSDLPYPLLHDGLLVPSFAAMIYGLAMGGGPLDWFLSRPLLI